MAVTGKLSARKVQNAKPGKYGDGGNLWLTVQPTGAKFWTFRYRWNGRAREMGLGPEHTISLAKARDLAQQARQLMRDGTDPLNARKEAERKARGMTFGEVADAYLDAHAPTFKSAKHSWQWRQTLDAHVLPKIGRQPVADVQTGDVMAVLEPIWRTIPETASRVRGRVERVLDYAKARGWRDGDNPARWRGHLDQLLPARSKVQRVEHHAALPWRDLPAFMGDLAKQSGTGARALAFTILTAARTGETIGATWAEIDLSARLWTVPAEKMKAGKEHCVPLSDAAMSILAEMVAHRRHDTDPIFPSPRPGKPLSNMAMAAVLKRMGSGDLTVHGFRSTVRDWISEATSYDHTVAEMTLAHTIASGVERAYRRGSLIEKRARLMADWAAYAYGSAVPDGEVMPIRGRG